MKKSAKNLRIAIGHDLLTKLGGAERVLIELVKIFPKSSIYTLVYDENFTKKYFSGKPIQSTFLQLFPKRFFRYLLPLMTTAVSSLRVPSSIDLAIIDSSSFAKGIHVPKNVPYILYLHTPTRFLWKDKDWYLQKSGRVPKFLSFVVNIILNKIKRWDYIAMDRPDIVITNSKNIANQCQKFYDRNPDFVLFPPVDVEKFYISKTVSDYFLLVGRIEPYKNIELAINSALDAGVKLKIAGEGSQKTILEAKYSDPKIEFLGKVSDQQLAQLYSQAKALIFPQEEDAGIVPLEAFASGCPVIALNAGGAQETVIPGITGEFFEESNLTSLSKLIKKFDHKRYNKIVLRKHALKFSNNLFRSKIQKIVEDIVNP